METMKITRPELDSMDRIRRLNIVNSLGGIKPANLVGTRSREGIDNLAIFNSAIHIGSDPPLIGLIFRPVGEVRRHTYENIGATGLYTLNSVSVDQTERAHLTSAKFGSDESEFDACGFEREFVDDFPAAFVKDSRIRLALEFREEVPLKINGTILLIGEIRLILIGDPKAVGNEGYIDFEALGLAGVSGLNSYYSLRKDHEFPYARPEQAAKVLKKRGRNEETAPS